MTVELTVGGYTTTRVAFEELPGITAAQRAASERWQAAAP